VKAILETFQSVEHARLESFWNNFHKERSYSIDWKVSGIAFTRNAHTQQIGNFLLGKVIPETFQSVEYERSL
jgi:hypothetical protein